MKTLADVTRKKNFYLRAVFLTLLLFFGVSCQNIQTEGEIPLKMPISTPEFVVQSGDTLQIMVWQNPDLTQHAVVRPDGKIRLLLVGELSVKGKTLEQIRREVIRGLTAYLKEPVVEVTLTSANFTFYLFGEIGRKGIVPARKNLTLLEALIMSGGFTNFADTKRVVVIRRVPGKEIRYRFNLATYLSGSNIQQNIYLQPGDIVYVPKVPF